MAFGITAISYPFLGGEILLSTTGGVLSTDYYSISMLSCCLSLNDTSYEPCYDSELTMLYLDVRSSLSLSMIRF